MTSDDPTGQVPIQPPLQPLASTCSGEPLLATCRAADSPPLATSTSPEATACMRATAAGSITSSSSMPSGFSRSGIRKAALVVVVCAVPIRTVRTFCPSASCATMAGAASAAAEARKVRRNIDGFPRGRHGAPERKAHANHRILHAGCLPHKGSPMIGCSHE